MYRRKRKNRRIKNLTIAAIISIIIICLIPIYIVAYNPTKEIFPKAKETKSIATSITNILSYELDETINNEFLTWISEEYTIEVLEQLENNLKLGTYTNQLWHELTGNSLIVLLDKYNNNTSDRTQILELKNEEITISFVGDVSLADNWYIMPKYDERNKKVYGILSEEVVEIMTTSDIMVANNEFTISDRGEKMPGKYYTFKGSPERLSIYEEMGVDLVTLANNHIYDFGEVAFNDALDALEKYKIPYIGAGRNIEEAKRPYYYIIGGYKIAFVNATRAEKIILTPEATATTGGVLRCYDPTEFLNVISTAKKNSDYVIALVHWGKEDSTELEQVQLDTSKQYLDAGADIIIGSHAHTLQGIDFYNNKAIIYNLGDFIFNNETKDTGIFQLKIDEEGKFQYYFQPCLEKDEYTSLLSGEEKTRVLDKMRKLSPNITIEEDGQFYSSQE